MLFHGLSDCFRLLRGILFWDDWKNILCFFSLISEYILTCKRFWVQLQSQNILALISIKSVIENSVMRDTLNSKHTNMSLLKIPLLVLKWHKIPLPEGMGRLSGPFLHYYIEPVKGVIPNDKTQVFSPLAKHKLPNSLLCINVLLIFFHIHFLEIT